MQIPIVTSLRELDPAPRRFLLFIVFNVISWQNIVGPTLILFARSLDMPPSWIGFLISFMPLSMVLVLFTVPIVNRFGPKRVLFTGWLWRNILVSAVFLIPFILQRYGLHAAQILLLCATLAFCILRALGAGGWLPWLHEVVPTHQRGSYFSTEAAVSQFMTVVVAFAQAALLSGHPGHWRFLTVYCVGIAAGLLSLVWMARVPGGHGVQDAPAEHASYDSYRFAWADRPFVRFVVVAALCFSCIAWMQSAIVLFMRDVLFYKADRIMLITAAGGAAVLFTIRSWGRFADVSGSASAMLLTMFGHSVGAAACLVLVPGMAWNGALVVFGFVLTSVFAAAFNMAAHRAMLNYVKVTGRVAYTNLWTVFTSVIFGVTPIMAGWLIDHWELAGYRTCFGIAVVGGILCGMASRGVVSDAGPLERSLAALINPALPVRMAARIVWITLGMHPSRNGNPSVGK